ncbi:MAG TPA: hypothetical protein VMH26_19090, partial [Burkholderiales bacterium]|nr:hypothetical protein [Burkholderiales bacterium]
LESQNRRADRGIQPTLTCEITIEAPVDRELTEEGRHRSQDLSIGTDRDCADGNEPRWEFVDQASTPEAEIWRTVRREACDGGVDIQQHASNGTSRNDLLIGRKNDMAEAPFTRTLLVSVVDALFVGWIVGREGHDPVQSERRVEDTYWKIACEQEVSRSGYKRCGEGGPYDDDPAIGLEHNGSGKQPGCDGGLGCAVFAKGPIESAIDLVPHQSKRSRSVRITRDSGDDDPSVGLDPHIRHAARRAAERHPDDTAVTKRKIEVSRPRSWRANRDLSRLGCRSRR